AWRSVDPSADAAAGSAAPKIDLNVPQRELIAEFQRDHRRIGSRLASQNAAADIRSRRLSRSARAAYTIRES
ncbi:hypothetical protein ACQ7B2_00835, partial [Escherichia coli]